MKLRVFLAVTLLGLITACRSAPPVVGDETVVPGYEREVAQHIAAEGPTETTGIESAIVLGSIVLGDEFAGVEGRVLRAREVTVLPGGRVAVHQHASRPGMAYVLEGELVEHRNDERDPVKRGVGAVAFEKTGVVHWWENESPRRASVLVVDIVPQGTE